MGAGPSAILNWCHHSAPVLEGDRGLVVLQLPCVCWAGGEMSSAGGRRSFKEEPGCAGKGRSETVKGNLLTAAASALH